MPEGVPSIGLSINGAPRRFPIFRPHWHERPTTLLARDFSRDAELDWIRIAKDKSDVIAAYEIKQNEEYDYSVLSVSVFEPYRNQGLGTWLLLHAIGLIESKGGRIIQFRCREHPNFVQRVGFILVEPGLYVLRLQPE